VARGRVKSKQELAAEQETARENALDTGLSSSNKGFRMLSKLGYKPGASLGATGATGATEPIRLVMKEDRGGIGLDSDRKRKFKEVADNVAKRAKEDEIDYRDRVRLEHLEKRRESQILAAQKVAEKFDTQADENDGAQILRPLKGANILWRGLARERLLREQERRMRHDLLQSSALLPSYVDPDEDEDDRKALGNETKVVAEEELEEEDPELDEFNALPSEERLEKLVKYLRKTHYYCFWCKHEYPDADLEGCPGLTEEDHD
jgi:Domain of unknown function (DUF4187)/G-patch domain